MENYTKNAVQQGAEICVSLPPPSIIRIYYGKKWISENTRILQFKVPSWSPSAKELEDLPFLPACLEHAWSPGVTRRVPIYDTDAHDIFASLRDQAIPECLFFK